MEAPMSSTLQAMTPAERLAKNLARWGNYRSTAAYAVGNLPQLDVHVCHSASGAANLCKDEGGQQFFYHAPTDPVEEANRWFASLPQFKGDTLYVFGIGLGYYYHAALPWLREDERRSLIFIEDDPQVIRRFFETETASAMLYDRQVFLDYMPSSSWPLPEIESLTLIFSFSDFSVSALQAYASRTAYQELKALIEFFSMTGKRTTLEYAAASLPFYKNFFPNMLEPHAFQIEHMCGAFAGIPAIICGAGPSLGKNVALLGTLKDRALLFAGGSAINALNAHGIDPHFGVGVDPNPSYYTRLVMSQAYETPFFYRTRMHHEAFKLVHGSKIYLPGNGGHRVSEWFEERLGIPGIEIQEGHNVLNLSLSIARLLGCNPILVAGTDLAYSQGESYAPGIVSHPIHDQKLHFRTKHAQEELLSKPDIYGQPTFTTWKWVMESLWYGNMAERNPELTLINVTEGGIGFPGVPNMTLAEAADKFLPPAGDVSGRVAGAVLNSPMPPSASQQSICLLVEEFKASLERCLAHAQQIEVAVCKLLAQMSRPGDFLPEPESELVLEWVAEDYALENEGAYLYDLKELNDAFIRTVSLDLQRLLFDKDVVPEKEIRFKKMGIDQQRYQCVNHCAGHHIELIESCLSDYKRAQIDHAAWLAQEGKGYLEELKKSYPVPQPDERDIYRFEDGRLTIEDRQMGISFQSDRDEPHVEEKQIVGVAAAALQLVAYRKDGLLHGPSTVSAADGSVLARSWFWQGQRQGKMWTYYHSGHLHSLQRFRNGIADGVQQYFYADGLPKSVLPYAEGVLHGDVILWHPGGRMARKLHFVHGKRHGEELFWDEHGSLRIEAHYQADKPVGIAKKWHANGNLAQEIEYDADSKLVAAKYWNEQGEPTAGDEAEKGDYFDEVTGQMVKLTASLDTVFEQVQQMEPLVSAVKARAEEGEAPKAVLPDASKELEELRREMEHLQSLTDSLKAEAGLGQDSHKEAIWKSPSSQRILEKQVDMLNQQMSAGLADIQKGLKDLFDRINKPADK